MCGIAGLWDRRHMLASGTLAATATQMATAIAHRGPDDSGLWHDAEQGIALSHRRLSIIDLSPLGHQPMVSASGRYVLSFNGEIYNYKELRAQLHYPFKGESDTEVLLAALSDWGIEPTLKAIHGMFAFALWDKQTRTLTLARDRVGEKPLYYGFVGEVFGFGSELHALRCIPDFTGSINRAALTQFIGYSYVGSPQSIYEGIQKLPAGHYVQITVESPAQTASLTPQPYWQFASVLREGQQKLATLPVAERTDALEAVLQHAVSQMMISDVPLGAFLSGGIDSSTIVALMQKQASAPVKTFSIGFDEKGFDEAPYAKAVAKHLGTDHTELYVSAQQALDVIPSLASMYDEPFADSSQIPTFLVAQMARKHVTVALSGDGGDELFGGYTRYRRGAQMWRAVSWLPHPLRKLLGAHVLPAATRLAQHVLPNQLQLLLKINNYAHKLSAKDKAQFYHMLCALCHNPSSLVLGSAPYIARDFLNDASLPYPQWMMAQDTLSYLPDDILVKVDRAAMSVSLETRVPFLDPNVIAFASALPLDMKIRGNQGKWLLRQVLYRHVPRELIDRPKAGFCIPMKAWLSGPLREWAEELLSQGTLAQQGYLDAGRVRALWRDHISGKQGAEHTLWNILMFQSWLGKTH